MLGYVMVAVGSALGGVARYWLGIAVVRLLGPSFPWGTILINVLGSFVIGFFGTMTGSQGLIPAPQAVRTLVMVGMCGGFTTFSSFSLQTLELARGDQWFGALANVVLSVVLCLASVTAGHVLATRIALLVPAEP